MFNMVSRDVNASKKLVRFPTDIYLPGASVLGNLATKMCQKYTVVIVFLVFFFLLVLSEFMCRPVLVL